MSSIRSIHNSLKDLIETQEEAVQALSRSASQAGSAKSAAVHTVQASAQALVISGDDARYGELTRAAKSAGSQYDFTSMVEGWKQQDAANREERSTLEKTWGTPAQVAEKARGIKQEMDTINSAISELAPEIGAFDATTAKIAAHNAKYPKAQITEETNAGYKQFSWKNLLLWLTFINRGPYKAYKVVSEYEKKYGDYFEDSRSIAKVRQNEAKLESDEATREKSYKELLGIGSRMSALDSSYKGPEGMASSIRGLVADLALKSMNFCKHLVSEVKTAEAEAAATANAKIQSLDAIATALSGESRAANSTLTQLQDAERHLGDAVGRVGNDTLFFDISGVERSVTHAARISKTAANEAADAVQSVANYQPAPGTDIATIESHLNNDARLQVKDNNLGLDFSQLKRSVQDAVDAYEAEQQRIREEQARIARAAALLAAQQEAAREAEAQRLRDLQNINTGFNDRSRRNDDIGSGDRGISPQAADFRRNSNDIGAGSFGIQQDSQDDISSGNDGINDRNDDISKGPDGIEP